MALSVFDTLTLPNGSILPNRIAKAAMEENMAACGHLPGDSIINLYKQWSSGGAGLLITGNVMIDHSAMTGPGGIVLEAETDLAPFKKWAKAGTQHGTHMWMQINHPGRQVFAAMGGKVLSPSDIALDMGKHSKLFGQPTPMTEDDIQELIQRFAKTASRAIEAGFNGVEIHAAHGYLLSQFLSPLTNHRTDQWGGSLDNRARLLYEVVKAVKAVLPKEAAIAVKLNSADFQRGGFEQADAIEVVKVLNEGVDMVGIGRALAFAPDLPNQWKGNPSAKASLPNVSWKDKTLSAMATMAITKRQLKRMGKGLNPKLNSSPLFSLIQDQIHLKKLTKVYRNRYSVS